MEYSTILYYALGGIVSSYCTTEGQTERCPGQRVKQPPILSYCTFVFFGHVLYTYIVSKTNTCIEHLWYNVKADFPSQQIAIIIGTFLQNIFLSVERQMGLKSKI